MTGWFGYARLFARRRAEFRKLADRHLEAAMNPALPMNRRAGHRSSYVCMVHGVSATNVLWRDFIADMERRG